MAEVKHANTHLVVKAWLSGVDGLDPAKLGALLPPVSEWAGTGYVRFVAIGGSSDLYLPVKRPVVQVDCYAVAVDAANNRSPKPPWNRANNLAETIRHATYATDDIRRRLTLPAGFPDARVLETYLLQEPRRVESDDAAFARFSFDMQFHWVQL